MHNMKRKVYTDSNDAATKPKERHIVTWSQEEDDILREQIRLHGTENWAIIASQFQDKTTRQCRRRWYTYLNSDFKKGGWSPEEDMLLCEAQKIYGNRWTEIAKVVSGRTDNAVKNRFSTLCKKRAKHEAMAKENNTSYINLHNKRVLLQDGLDTTGTQEVRTPLKKMRRSHIPDPSEICAQGEKVLQESETKQQLRPPFSVLIQDLPNQPLTEAKDAIINAAQSLKAEGTFLKKNDPKITALMQQAELLSSLALKVNTDNTDHSLENAWKVLQDFLNQTKEIDALPDIDLQLEEFKDLIEDLRSSNEETQPSWRQPDLCQESPDGSEKSTGSTHASHTAGPEDEMAQTDKAEQIQISESRNQPLIEEKTGDSKSVNSEAFAPTADQEDFPSFHEAENYVTVPAPSTAEFSSPPQVTPLFRSLAAGIPSPQFSESERNFLMKALGMESPYAHLSNKPSQPPPTCKRVLLHSL